MEIYLHDLNKEVQKAVLEFYKYNTAEDGNLDVVPLFILECHDPQNPSITCQKCNRGAYEMDSRIVCCNCHQEETTCNCKKVV